MSSNKLIGFGIVYTMAAGIQKAIGFISFMYLAIILTVKDYALFGIYYALFTVVGTLSYSGIIESVVSLLKKCESKKERHFLFQISGATFLLLSGLTFLFVFPIQAIFYQQEFSSFLEIILIMFSAFFSTYFVLQSFLVRLNEDHKASLVFSFVPQVLGYLVGFLFAYWLKTPLAFFIGACIGYLLSISVYLLRGIQFYGFCFDYLQIKKVVKNLIPYSLVAFIAWVLGYGYTYIVDLFFDSDQVALYIYLYTISSILQLIGSSMNQVWSPRFFNQYSLLEQSEIEIKYKKFSTFQGFVLGISGLFLLLLLPSLSIFSKSLIVYSNNRIELMWLFMGYIACIPWWRLQNYYFINNYGNKLMRITFVSGIFGLLFWVISMYFLGPIGIYIGFFINSLIRSFVIYIDSKRTWNLSFDYKALLLGFSLLMIVYLL